MPYLKTNSECSPSSTHCHESHHQKQNGSPDAFDTLVEELSAALGPSSGLDSDDVDPLNIQRLMEKYTSNEAEWGPYAFSDASRTYTRNLVDEGNGKSNLVSFVLRRRSLPSPLLHSST
jgi:hypothetical protein